MQLKGYKQLDNNLTAIELIEMPENLKEGPEENEAIPSMAELMVVGITLRVSSVAEQFSDYTTEAKYAPYNISNYCNVRGSD